MRASSDTMPQAVSFERVGHTAYVRFAENITPKAHDENGITYEYDEYVLQCIYRDNLQEDILSNHPEWLQLAMQTETDRQKTRYRIECARRIQEAYSMPEEQAVKTEAISALLEGRPVPERYTAFVGKIEGIKDAVYREVYGTERK